MPWNERVDQGCRGRIEWRVEERIGARRPLFGDIAIHDDRGKAPEAGRQAGRVGRQTGDGMQETAARRRVPG